MNSESEIPRTFSNRKSSEADPGDVPASWSVVTYTAVYLLRHMERLIYALVDPQS